MITGDARPVAEAVAADLGLRRVRLTADDAET
jgi:cation transport ATPase